ncbi:helix-turn-helix domain-containing protein [Microbacterium proteolyticum]|uniref:helix-turn-helix domain-containing protein n=1 Tax=Microbacterium proteolyticum TaxID=1572644 RepID=UPI00345B7375
MTERNDLPALATRSEAAATLRVSVRTVDRLIASGDLPASKHGRSVRIPVSALMSSAGTAPADGPPVGEASPIASPTTPSTDAAAG